MVGRSKNHVARGSIGDHPDNDANYGALGEHQYGAGRDAQNLIYIRIGPGIGGGLIIDDQLHRGDRGFELGAQSARQSEPSRFTNSLPGRIRRRIVRVLFSSLDSSRTPPGRLGLGGSVSRTRQ